MKLRIKGNSLRLRLTRGEVARLATDGKVAENMELPGAVFAYEVQADSSATTVSAALSGNTLRVGLPHPMVQKWASTDEISLRATQGPLVILVEKDFACLQPREGDDDADTFPHPKQEGC